MLKIFSKRYLYILITVFWIITMTALIMKHYVPEGLQSISYTSPLPDELCEKQWMGVYFQGDKIGYFYRKITELENGYNFSEKMKVRLKMLGVEKEVETILDAYADRILRLESFTFSLNSDVDIDIKGYIEGKTLFITMQTGNVTSRKEVRLSERPYLDIAIVPYILKRGLEVGSTVNIPVINPMDLSQEYIKIEVLGKGYLMSMGENKNVYKLKGSFKGIETVIWITKDGVVLREDSPMGFLLVKETKYSAVKPGKSSIDVITHVAIPFNLSLPPDDTEYLKLRISGVDLKRLEIDGGRQRLHGDILEITKESPSSFSSSHPVKNPGDYLRESIFVQSKAPAISSLSKKIVNGEKNLLKKTRLIYEWVYRNIEKVPMISIPVATDVLSTMKGDCNEHTVLFTALARSAGIPTRIAVGLTYQDGFFYYHAWPEVYFEKWVAVDPTLGQFPADASHIRLLTGDIDRQWQLLSIIGKLKLEGIEYRK